MNKATFFILTLTLVSFPAFAADTIVSTTVNYFYKFILVFITISSSALAIMGLSLLMSTAQLIKQSQGGLASVIMIGLLLLAAGTGSLFTTVGVELGLMNAKGEMTYKQGSDTAK